MKGSLIIAAAVLLAACNTMPKQEKEAAARAKALCERVNVNGYGIQLNLGPKANGDKPSPPVLQTRPGATGESLLYQVYWNQNLCSLSQTVPGFPVQRIDKWVEETGQAFDAWRPLKPESYDADRTALVTARNTHLARLAMEASGGNKAGTPMSLELFKKVFPRHDFFNVVEFDAGIDLGPGTKFKGVDLSKLDPQVTAKPSEFSTAIRPALNSTYQAVGFYAMNQVNDLEMVRLAVASVYQAGITRIDDAKLAQRPAAPASSSRN